jgi:hypothetical protein
MPSSSKPMGTLTAGWPVMLNGEVNEPIAV